MTTATMCTIDQIKHFLNDLQFQLDAIKESKQDTVVDLQSELDATIQSEKADEEPVQKPVEEKRPSSSLWGRIREAVRKGFKAKKESSTYASDSVEGSSSRKSKRNSRQDQEEANLEILKLQNEILKLQNDIRQMKGAFEKLAHFQSSISKSLEIEVPLNKLRAILQKTDSVKSRARDLKEIRRRVLNLKGQIPLLLKKQSSIGLSITDSQTGEENGQIVETGSDISLPGLPVSEDLEHWSAFEEVLETKLSITVNRYQFKVGDFMESLKELKQLESLKIAWGARFSDEEGVKGGKTEETNKEKTQKHKGSKEGEDDQAHKKGETSEEKNNEDGNKKAKLEEEGKKRHEVNAESLKSDEVVEGDKGKAGAEEEGKKVKEDKGKAATEEGKKQDKVDEEKSRSEEDGVEEDKKASPSPELTNTIENKKTDDKQEEKRDGEKEKVHPEEEKKKDKVTSPPQESKETVKNKPDDHQRGDKQEEKRVGENDKTEGEKKDELKAEKSEPGKVDKKTSPPQESKDTVTSKPDDHRRGDIQEEKRDGEKDIIEEGEKKDELKAENSKPDKVVEKTSPAQESKDSKADDHKENSKDGEKIKAALKKPDEGEAKTQKLDKNKLGKKVSFSEEPRAPVQKKPATKESGSRISKLFTMTRTETKKQGKGKQEDSGIDTSKLPSSLKKLELECYPEREPPVWLNPKTFDNLEKLSIKGGNLRRFSDEPLTAENKCGVQILRLKYLHEFKARWKDLHALFPQLKLLEKYKCPEVAFCPTDGNGVWRSQP
ncbi:hypothetical protein Bca4012_013402 [Brassica carinata]